MLNKIYNMDCLEGMKNIPDNSIDLVLTDPPYNASNCKIVCERKQYRAINKEWDKNFKTSFFDICASKLKEGGQMIIFCSHHLLGEYLMKKSLKLEQILHWIDMNSMPSLTKRYAETTEYMLWFVKRGKPYTFHKKKRFDFKNIYITKNRKWKQTKHVAEKPLILIKHLVETHSNEGDTVLDPFIGSGTTALACILTKRNYIGFEIDKNYYEIAQKRIKEYTAQKRL